MKWTTATLLMLSLLAVPLFAQNGPRNLTADIDQLTGEVTLNWALPFIPDYVEEFDDGAPGWDYDNDDYWSVVDGHLVGEAVFDYGQWIMAAYTADVFYEQVVEVELTRTAGNTGSPMAVFLRSSAPGGDPDDFDACRVSIYPWGITGLFWIHRIVDGVVTQITPGSLSSDAINIGLGASNVVSVSVFNHEWQVFINGEFAFSWEDQSLSVGHVGVGFSDLEGNLGTVEYEYVAVDDLDIDPDPGPNLAPVNGSSGPIPLTFIDDPVTLSLPGGERVRAGERRPALAERRAHRVEPRGILDRDGGGSGELDSITEFRIYRDGSMVGVTEQLGWMDPLPDYGTYEYIVTAFYDTGESDASNEVSVTWHDQALFPVYEDFDDGLPDSWTVEGLTATLNWHVDYGYEWNAFPTPYMIINSAEAGWMGDSCVNVAGRLITPPVDLDNPETVQLEYDYVFTEYMDEILEVAWSADGMNWTPIVLYDSESEGNDVVHDVTDAVAGEDQVWFSFYYDDQDQWGYRAGVDNVSVFVDQEPGPYSFTLTPIVDEIPQSGGTLSYDAHLMTTIGQSFPGTQYWTEVVMPNGTTYGPISVLNLPTIPPFADLSALDLTQEVPAFAPAGDYLFVGNVGYMGPPIYVSDSFTFTKAGADVDGEYAFDPAQWTSGPIEFVAVEAAAEAGVLPAEFALEAAYPNPFNPSTTIAVSLPAAAELTVTVYNVVGQQVAKLASGEHAAGRHAFVFDASSLASGLYFVQATVPGELNQTRKVMLVR